MLNEGTVYRDVVRVKRNKKGRSCEEAPRPGKGKDLDPWNLERAEQVFPELWP